VFPAHLKISEIDATDTKGTKHYVALLSDISFFKTHEHELQQLAHFDALTGLPNRIILADRLQNAMAMATRHQRVLAVAFLDLDGFKAVNDTYGHDVGDLLLIQMADRLGRLLRDSDTLVRLGGDEFVVLLPDLNDPESCRIVIQRLLQALSSPIDIRNHRIQVSASIGVAFYPQGVSMDAEQLLRQADQAMYAAKMAGKNQCHYAPLQAADDRQPLAG
jgi:diguanylate cyclase (GGDEF)-like protein